MPFAQQNRQKQKGNTGNEYFQMGELKLETNQQYQQQQQQQGQQEYMSQLDQDEEGRMIVSDEIQAVQAQTHPPNEVNAQHLTQSQLTFLLHTIKQTLSHRPLHQVLHVLYRKHVLKQSQEQIFASKEYLHSQEKFFMAESIAKRNNNQTQYLYNNQTQYLQILSRPQLPSNQQKKPLLQQTSIESNYRNNSNSNLQIQQQPIKWKSIKPVNGIPRIQSFNVKNNLNKLKLKKSEPLRVMDYDEQKSVEDYDQVIRNTIQQGSLASYSKTYKRKQKSTNNSTHQLSKETVTKSNNNKTNNLIMLEAQPQYRNKSHEQQKESHKNKQQLTIIPLSRMKHQSQQLNHPQENITKLQPLSSHRPTQKYWTEQTTRKFIHFYCQNPTLNYVKDSFNKIEQFNQLVFDTKFVKSKYGKLMRQSIRKMIMRRQQVEVECQSEGIRCRMPMIFKLKDDKVKSIMSTPSAKELRIKLFKLYLQQSTTSIHLLQQTIITVNNFVQKQFGPMFEYEPLGTELSSLAYINNNMENSSEYMKRQKEVVDTLDKDYRSVFINGRYIVTEKNNSFKQEMTQINQIINKEAKKLFIKDNYLNGNYLKKIS